MTRAKTFQKIAAALADQAKVNAEKVIAAAAVILSHSLADDVFTEVCKIAIKIDPDQWPPEINSEKTFSIEQLKEKGTDALLAEELQRFGNGLSKKSLPNRAELLFKHVPLDQHKNLPTDEVFFKMEKLKEFDQLRHDLVHSDGLPNINPAKGSPAMIFLHEAAQTALRSVANAYGLTLDFEYVKSLGPPKQA